MLPNVMIGAACGLLAGLASWLWDRQRTRRATSNQSATLRLTKYANTRERRRWRSHHRRAR
jgi:hypothetical protein